MIQIIDSNESKRALVVVEEIFLERGDSEFIYKPIDLSENRIFYMRIHINNLSKDVWHKNLICQRIVASFNSLQQQNFCFLHRTP